MRRANITNIRVNPDRRWPRRQLEAAKPRVAAADARIPEAIAIGADPASATPCALPPPLFSVLRGHGPGGRSAVAQADCRRQNTVRRSADLKQKKKKKAKAEKPLKLARPAKAAKPAKPAKAAAKAMKAPKPAKPAKAAKAPAAKAKKPKKAPALATAGA